MLLPLAEYALWVLDKCNSLGETMCVLHCPHLKLNWGKANQLVWDAIEEEAAAVLVVNVVVLGNQQGHRAQISHHRRLFDLDTPQGQPLWEVVEQEVKPMQ